MFALWVIWCVCCNRVGEGWAWAWVSRRGSGGGRKRDGGGDDGEGEGDSMYPPGMQVDVAFRRRGWVLEE